MTEFLAEGTTSMGAIVTVRIRKDIDEADEMALDTRSTRTVRVGGGAKALS